MKLFTTTFIRLLTLASVSVLINACSKSDANPDLGIQPAQLVQSVRVGAVNTATSEVSSNSSVSSLGAQSFSAEIRPQVESRLAFRVGGKITTRLVELGATVQKGQVLLKLDATDLNLAAQASTAQITAAKANDDVAQAAFKRAQELLKQGFVSAGSVEITEGQAKAAKANLQAVQASGNVQSNASQYAVLVADAAGVVTGIDAEVGQVVAAGTPVLRVSNGMTKDVVFAVPETLLSELRGLRGKPVAVQLWAQPSETFSAVVRDIAAIADPASRSFIVKASLLGNADLPLGSTATVLLPSKNNVAAATPAIAVPLAAVVELQGKPAVWVVNAGTVKLKPVMLGAAQGDTVLVLSGLVAGAEIVTAGTHTLHEGQAVKSALTPLQVPAAAAVTAATSATSANTVTAK